MRKVEYVILGAGVAGICASRLLHDAGVSDLIVLDQYKEPGGNQKSFEINGYTYDIGAFYYWPSMPMFRMFPEMQKSCVQTTIRIERISPSGIVGPYPFSLHTEFLSRGMLYCLSAFWSIARARLGSRSFVTAQDYAIYWMGRKLYVDLGMSQYIERFFGIPATGIEAQFAVNRMSSVPELGKIGYWLRKAFRYSKKALRLDRSPAEALIVRPEAGLPHMYGLAVNWLTERGAEFRLSTTINSIEKRGDFFEISTSEGNLRTANLVSTIPIKQVSKFFDVEQGQDLEYVNLATLFISFAGDRGFGGCILYNWGPVGRWKRLTMHSDYYGSRNGREYASVEVPLFRNAPQNIKDLYEDFVASANKYKLFKGDLRLEDHRMLEDAYPAYTPGTSAKVGQIISKLKELGIQSVGRQGRFDYLPTGEHVAKQVAENLTMQGRRLHLP
jgi:protoporphyrinogen oxidase